MRPEETINNINFGLLDRSAAEAEARDLAIASAQAEAKAIASAAGVQLGALNSVNVNSSSVGTPYYDGMMGGGGSSGGSYAVAASEKLPASTPSDPSLLTGNSSKRSNKKPIKVVL